VTTRRACALTALYLLATGCAESSTTSRTDFEVIAQLDLGRNPHQISFAEDGRTAYVATAGEDRITIVDGVPPN